MRTLAPSRSYMSAHLHVEHGQTGRLGVQTDHSFERCQISGRFRTSNIRRLPLSCLVRHPVKSVVRLPKIPLISHGRALVTVTGMRHIYTHPSRPFTANLACKPGKWCLAINVIAGFMGASRPVLICPFDPLLVTASRPLLTRKPGFSGASSMIPSTVTFCLTLLILS